MVNLERLIPGIKISRQLLLLSILILYTLFVFVGIAHHEPWRDEAQSWLLVRNLSFPDLLRILPSEGHPPLWYLLILPLAKSGAPYISQNYLSGTIMIATAGLLLFKTRFPPILKITILFSFLFLYEYAVIARSYCLIPFFITLIVALYPARFKRPWLFALAVVGLFNTHMLVFTFAASIAGIFAIDAFQQKAWNKRTIGAFILMTIGGGYLIPYLVISSATANSFGAGIDNHIGTIARIFSGAFFVDDNYKYAGTLVMVVLAALLLRQPKVLFILLGGMAGIIYILGFKYAGVERHQGALFFCILGAYAIAEYYNRVSTATSNKASTTTGGIILLAILLHQDYVGIGNYLKDIKRPYSDAADAAQFLKVNRLDSQILVGNKSFAASALLPFLKKGTQLYYPDCKRWGSYIVYDECTFHHMLSYTPDSAAITAATVFRGHLQAVVLILNSPLEHPETVAAWRLIYSPPCAPMRGGEKFYIYIYNR